MLSSDAIDGGLVVTGFLVGMLVGLTGMGGGAIMTPFLISVVGVGPVVAVGTDLVYSAATKIVGAWLHARQQTVDFGLAKRLATGSIPAGLLAVAAIRFLPGAGVDADLVVRRALGGVLVLVAILMLCRIFIAGERVLSERWRRRLKGRGRSPPVRSSARSWGSRRSAAARCWFRSSCACFRSARHASSGPMSFMPRFL